MEVIGVGGIGGVVAPWIPMEAVDGPGACQRQKHRAGRLKALCPVRQADLVERKAKSRTISGN